MITNPHKKVLLNANTITKFRFTKVFLYIVNSLGISSIVKLTVFVKLLEDNFAELAKIYFKKISKE